MFIADDHERGKHRTKETNRFLTSKNLCRRFNFHEVKIVRNGSWKDYSFKEKRSQSVLIEQVPCVIFLILTKTLQI